MKKKNFFLIGGLSLAGIAAGAIGGYFLIKIIAKPKSYTSSNYLSDTSVKEILKARVKKELQQLKASDFLQAPDPINAYLDFQFEPNVTLNILEKKFILGYEIIANSIDDYSGTLQIRVIGIEKTPQSRTEETIITVSGFKSVKKLSSIESIWFTNELNKIENLSLKTGIINLNTQNFWDTINLPTTIEKNGDNYTTKDGTNKSFYSFEAEVKQHRPGSYVVQLSLGYTNNSAKQVSKLFLINDQFNGTAWNTNLDPLFLKNVLPGNLNIFGQEQLRELFFANKSDYSSIEVIKHLSNNDDGWIYLKRKTKEGIVDYAKYKLTTYNQIFEAILHDKKTKILEFLNNDLNVVNNQKDILQLYNRLDGFNFRFSRLTTYVHDKLKDRQKYLTNTLKINDTMQLFDLTNFRKNTNDQGLTLDFINVSDQAYSVFFPFTAPNKPKNNLNLNPQALPIRSINELQEEIHRRTMSIAFYEKRIIDGEEKDYVTSGTAWILDKSKTEKNTYFLATNIHVIERLQANWENIFGFQYSLYNNIENLELENSSFYGQRIQPFRSIRKKIDGNFQVVPEEKEIYDNFWNKFEIYNLGANVFGKGTAADMAVIKLTFPEDLIDQHGVTIVKNFPDAALFYDQMQQNNTTKLKFFTNEHLVWNNQNPDDSITNGLDVREASLPMDLTLGGYLGGSTWITNTGSGFLYYSNINKNTKINFYDNFKDPNQRTDHADFFRNPFQIVIPLARAGRGMSGSMVLDRYGRIVGIFWGGSFNDSDNNESTQSQVLEKGIANLEPIGISVEGNKSILQRWLDLTNDQNTDLDDL